MISKIQMLSDICSFADGRVAVAALDLDTYISTENMLPNKEGITRSAGLPTINQTQAYQTDDVLISNIRPYFKKIWCADRDGGCSNDVLVMRAKEGCDPGFLYYLLSDDNFFDYAMATAKGTKMPRGDKSAIMRYEVPDLPIDVQIGISDTLSVLDSRIATNKAINNHLAQMAQAIFAEQCKQGETAVLSDILTVCYGKDHKRLGDGMTPCYGSGGIMRYVDAALYSGESVLIPRKGSLNNVLYINEPFWTVDTMFYTHMTRPNVAKFVYFTVRDLDLAGMNVGSAVPSMTTAVLNALEIVLPNDEVLASFEEIVSPMFLRMQANNVESARLVALRETLLPRLMSGELSVAAMDAK